MKFFSPHSKHQLEPDILALVDAVPHQNRVISVGLKLVEGSGVVGAGDHEGVQGDGANVVLDVPHPHRLRLDTVHCQDCT